MKSEKNFSIAQLMAVAAYIALVTVGFQEHWFGDANLVFWWYRTDGLLNSLVFSGKAHSFCLFVSLLAVPWLIIETLWRLVSLLKSVDFAKLRKQQPIVTSLFVFARMFGVVFLLYWLLAPLKEVWQRVDFESQLWRNLSLFFDVAPLLGLIFVAVMPLRLRPLSRPEIATEKPRFSRISQGICYLLCFVAIVIIGGNSLISPGVTPALVAIATHSMEQSMPTGVGVTGSLQLPDAKFSIYNFRDLYDPLIPIVCCSVLSIATSLWIGRFEQRVWRVGIVFLWLCVSAATAVLLCGVVENLLESQSHWFYLLKDYTAGLVFAVLICGLMTLLLLSMVRATGGTWRQIDLTLTGASVLSVPKIPLAVAVACMPISINDGSVTLVILAILTCFDAFRIKKNVAGPTDLELYSPRQTPFTFLLKWLACFTSVVLSAITFGIFGTVLFTKTNWPIDDYFDWYHIERWIERISIFCWLFLVLAFLGVVVRTLLRWRRNRARLAQT